MQGSIPPKSDNRELSFVDAPPDKTIFDLLLLPPAVPEERIFRFPFRFMCASISAFVAVGDISEDVDEFKFNLFCRWVDQRPWIDLLRTLEPWLSFRQQPFHE